MWVLVDLHTRGGKHEEATVNADSNTTVSSVIPMKDSQDALLKFVITCSRKSIRYLFRGLYVIFKSILDLKFLKHFCAILPTTIQKLS